MNYYIIIRGPLGCGKSTISAELSKRINGNYFSIDRVLNDNDLLGDKEEGYISQKSFVKANEIACKKTTSLLKQNQPIIFDGNFYWKSQIDDLIKRLDFPHYIFTLKAPLEICIKRDSKRDKSHGEIAARVVYKKSTEFDYGTLIDVTKPLQDCLDEIISYLPEEY